MVYPEETEKRILDIPETKFVPRPGVLLNVWKDSWRVKFSCYYGWLERFDWKSVGEVSAVGFVVSQVFHCPV